MPPERFTMLLRLSPASLSSLQAASYIDALLEAALFFVAATDVAFATSNPIQLLPHDKPRVISRVWLLSTHVVINACRPA